MDPYTNASLVDVIITQSHSWTLSRYVCNQVTINTLGPYFDSAGGAQPSVACRPGPAPCVSSGFVTIQQPTFCTDFSLAVQISSGSLITRMTLDRSTNILVGYSGGNWATVIQNSLGNPAAGWEVDTHIDLTQKYPINSSPGRPFRQYIYE